MMKKDEDGHRKYTDKHGTVWKKASLTEKRAWEQQNNQEIPPPMKADSLLDRSVALRFSGKQRPTVEWVQRWYDFNKKSPREMNDEQLTRMKEHAKAKWERKRENRQRAKALKGKDYTSLFERKRTQVGYRKARWVIPFCTSHDPYA